jgi:type I restriction enzyme S subunit
MSVPKLRFKEFKGKWEDKKIGSICDSIVPGRNKPVDFDGNIPWITTPDIEQNGIIYDSKKGLRVTKEEAKKVGSKIVPKNSIIISCVGDLGLVAVVGNEIIINQQLHAFIPKEDIYYQFLLYSLSIRRGYMEKVATKTAVPYMNKDNCNSIPISYPSYKEQSKIADFLMAVDEKIAQLTQKCELLARYKKGVMQQIFSQELRFKDDDGSDFPDWEEKKLIEISNKISDGIHSTPKYDDNGEYYFINGNNLTNNRIECNEITKRVDISEYLKYRSELTSQTILISINGTIGNLAFYNNEKIILGKSACYINLKLEENKNFVFYLLQTSTIKSHFEKELTGSTIKNLSLTTIKNTQAFFPVNQEQAKIANFLTSIDEKITEAQTYLDTVKQYKQGLLQQMFV